MGNHANDADSAFAPRVVKPKTARRMGCWGQARLYELINKGELESYREGRSRLITVASIERYIARKVTEGSQGEGE
jgi:hypothetical protein